MGDMPRFVEEADFAKVPVGVERFWQDVVGRVPGCGHEFREPDPGVFVKLLDPEGACLRGGGDVLGDRPLQTTYPPRRRSQIT